MKTIIRNASVVLPSGKVQETDIVIEQDKIASVGKSPEGVVYDREIDGRNKLAIPGFVNAHTHASMTLLRSYADDMSLMDWLSQEIWPIEAKMRREDIYWGAALAAVEMIQSGTTAFADMYGPWMVEVAKIIDESGLRGAICRAPIVTASLEGAEKTWQENIWLYENYNGSSDGRVIVLIGAHAIYTCPPDFLHRMADSVAKLGARIHIHMSETKGEVENAKKEYGKSPFQAIAETGYFNNGGIAAHSVYVDDEDMDIMKQYKLYPAHNPTSNMKLASGISPVARMLEKGIHVAIGTDGASSNNNLDMLEEVTLAALLHKVDTLDPLAVPAFKALQMGTEYGAEALGFEDCGRIEAGCQADIVLLNMKGAAWTPNYNPISLLVYSANSSSVDTVMVAGKVLMEHRELKTLDEEKIIYEANRCAKRLTGK
ncbi:MAG: amidohydrolase [Selenomonadaceae bacterium]|nr:amidohydrolase [Selenomonadaceae bacterium]